MWLCCLTFELTGARRRDALARLAKMYSVPPTGPRWPAVARPVERGVRQHPATVDGVVRLEEGTLVPVARPGVSRSALANLAGRDFELLPQPREERPPAAWTSRPEDLAGRGLQQRTVGQATEADPVWFRCLPHQGEGPGSSSSIFVLAARLGHSGARRATSFGAAASWLLSSRRRR